MNITNKVVLVTGSSSGIGEEIALAFAKQGALVALHGRNEKRLLKVKKRIDEIQGKSHGFIYDLGYTTRNLEKNIKNATYLPSSLQLI